MEDTAPEVAGEDGWARPARAYPDRVTILYTTDARYLDHDTGRHHPERPARLTAVEAGIESSGVAEAVVRFEAIPASPALVAAAHPGAYLAALDRFVQEGGGHLDADTVMSAGLIGRAVIPTAASCVRTGPSRAI